MGAQPSDTERGPAVLIIGGLLTSWLWYWPVANRFRDRGASRVTVARLWLWHWLVAGFAGPARSTSVVAAAIDGLAAQDGRPILVVGHSGGGILARLALARRAFGAARLARRDAVGAVVTLGTPHLATHFGGSIGRHGLRALRFLRALDHSPGPGDPWATLTVGGRLPDAPASGASSASRLRRRFSALCYTALLGRDGRDASGDGLVPFQCALLPHGEGLPLPGYAHAPFLGSPWYLSNDGIDQWWGRAVELWQGAVIGGPASDAALQSDA